MCSQNGEEELDLEEIEKAKAREEAERLASGEFISASHIRNRSRLVEAYMRYNRIEQRHTRNFVRHVELVSMMTYVY